MAVHYRWHPLCGKSVRLHPVEHRVDVAVAHVEASPGIVTIIPAWMLDLVACAGIGLGAPQVSALALSGLHGLLVERGGLEDTTLADRGSAYAFFRRTLVRFGYHGWGRWPMGYSEFVWTKRRGCGVHLDFTGISVVGPKSRVSLFPFFPPHPMNSSMSLIVEP